MNVFQERGAAMEYKSIGGPIFSCQALSPPVINSAMATKLGIKAPCMTEPGQYTGFEAGNNVKLRLVVDGGEKRLTCHGVIDWVKFDEATANCYIGFGSLSLSDEEFRVLQRNLVEESDKPVEFVRDVREKGAELECVVVADTEILEKKYADGISMSRPFIREPHIVKKIKEGKAEAVACVSCNRCFAAVAINIPVQCYVKGFPAF